MPRSTTFEPYEGGEVEIELVRRRSGGGARLDLDQEDGPRWRVDVTREGNLDTVVTTWNSDGQLADIDLPDWIDTALLQLQRV